MIVSTPPISEYRMAFTELPSPSSSWKTNAFASAYSQPPVAAMAPEYRVTATW